MRTWLARLGLPAALLLLAMTHHVPFGCGPGDTACQASATAETPPAATKGTATAEQTSSTGPETQDAGFGTAWSRGTPIPEDVVLNAAYTVDFDSDALSSLSIEPTPDAFSPPLGLSLASNSGGRAEAASPALQAYAEELGACSGDTRCLGTRLGASAPATPTAGSHQPTTSTENQNVPEPSVSLLLALGVVTVATAAWRRCRNA